MNGGGLDPSLTELSLERLRLRRSAKWARYPADVLPAWVAEMDFPLAERRLPVSLRKLATLTGFGVAVIHLAQALEAYARTQQRVTLARRSEAQASDLAFSRAHAP